MINGFRAAENPAVRLDQLHRVLEFCARYFREARNRFLERLIVDGARQFLSPARDPEFAKAAIAIVNDQRLEGGLTS